MQSHDLDLHRLELRFAASRLVEPRAVERIARSIERCGQIVPCIVVAGGGEDGAMVVVDGYRRIAAVRQLGRDTVRVEVWPCSVTEALARLSQLEQVAGDLWGGEGAKSESVQRRALKIACSGDQVS